MARTLELDTITEPSNSGTANITLSSDTTTTMPLVDVNGGAIDGTTLGVASPSSVAATTLTASGATTLNGDVTLGNASADTITVTGTMAGIDNKSGMTGEIRMWGGSSAPTGWLLCDGAAVSRSTYSALFAITSTSFGIGDGSSTFNVPDMEGRSPVGVGTGAGGGLEDADGSTVPAGGAALTARSLGEWTGAEILTSGQLAAHTHTGTTDSTTPGAGGSTTPGATGSAGTGATGSGGTGNTSGHSATHTHQIYVQGGTRVNTVAGGGDTGSGAGGAMYAYNQVGHTSGDANTDHHHTGPAHTHTGPAHTHTSAAHTHTGAAHTHGFTSGSTGSADKFTTPIMCVNFIIKT